jgi:hypothetical protein
MPQLHVFPCLLPYWQIMQRIQQVVWLQVGVAHVRQWVLAHVRQMSEHMQQTLLERQP